MGDWTDIKMILTAFVGIIIISLLFVVSHQTLTDVDYTTGYNSLRIDEVKCDTSFSPATKTTRSTYNVTVTDPVSSASYTFTDAASYYAVGECEIGQVYDCKYHVNTRNNKFLGYSNLELVDVFAADSTDSEEL